MAAAAQCLSNAELLTQIIEQVPATNLLQVRGVNTQFRDIIHAGAPNGIGADLFIKSLATPLETNGWHPTPPPMVTINTFLFAKPTVADDRQMFLRRDPLITPAPKGIVDNMYITLPPIQCVLVCGLFVDAEPDCAGQPKEYKHYMESRNAGGVTYKDVRKTIKLMATQLEARYGIKIARLELEGCTVAVQGVRIA